MWSMTTVNLILAAFSMLMAVVALGLLAFIIAREHHSPRGTIKSQFGDRIKRHESVVVDFRDPSTIPEHFLQLNTLMFEKRKHKANNNQIKEVEKNKVISLAGMEKMMTPISEEDELSQRSQSSAQSSFIQTTNKAKSSSSEEGFYSNSARSSLATTSDSEVENIDETINEQSLPNKDSPEISNSINRAKRSLYRETANSDRSGNDNYDNPAQIGKKIQKGKIQTKEIVLKLECGNEFSLC